MKCPNCGNEGPHYVPPIMGDPGFYMCSKKGLNSISYKAPEQIKMMTENLTNAPAGTRWDRRFLDMAKLVSTWSKDPSTKCGAVIVRPDRTIASLGYNGFPRGIKDNNRLLFTREAKYQRIVHCEMNALLNYDGLVRGFTLYTWPFLSCNDCAKHVIQAGITRCVAPVPSEDVRSRWEKSLGLTKSLFEEAGVEYLELNLGE